MVIVPEACACVWWVEGQGGTIVMEKKRRACLFARLSLPCPAVHPFLATQPYKPLHEDKEKLGVGVDVQDVWVAV